MNSDTSSKIQGAIIAVIGTVIAGLVTAQLKKMLDQRSLSERTADLKAAMADSGLTVEQIRTATSSWISQAASKVADRASAIAAKRSPDVVAHKVDELSRP